MSYNQFIEDVNKCHKMDELLYVYVNNYDYHYKAMDRLIQKIYAIMSSLELYKEYSELYKNYQKTLQLLYMMYVNTDGLDNKDMLNKNKIIATISNVINMMASKKLHLKHMKDPDLNYIDYDIMSAVLGYILYLYPKDLVNVLNEDSYIAKYFLLYLIEDRIAFHNFDSIKKMDEIKLQNVRRKIYYTLLPDVKDIMIQAISETYLLDKYRNELDDDELSIVSAIYSYIEKYCMVNVRYNDMQIMRSDVILPPFVTKLCQYYFLETIDRYSNEYSKYLTDDSSTYHIYTIIQIIKAFDERLKKFPKVNNISYYKFVKNLSEYLTNELYAQTKLKDKRIKESLTRALIFNAFNLTTLENKETVLQSLESFFDRDYEKYTNKIAMEAEASKSTSRKIHEGKKKFYAAYKAYKDKEEAVDNQLTKMANTMKDKFMGDSRTEIIEGKQFTVLGIVKKALRTAAIFSFSKIGGLLFFVVRYALRKDRTEEEKKKMILELEMESKILEEKIQDASSDGDREAKYSMMRTKAEIDKAIKKIEYGTTIDDRAIKTAAKFLKGNK